ncbi:acyl-CoA dehydrogenase family protein [Parasphingopyxis lamellibrachiae]|uniref:Putative acyl-CoA dehydrogenase n=1 Tax=Parasphingopyxis lamellibrachiae TaxID=680125 RepID=A0A3D9FL44_9SPHN|nr:acyl-CoA dehydrogenase family protein [Parasphingopyxis lamellibrachiae]RED17816.1 putative acyl-CoA dehydrogenase [Parasphingopyxis lamellibrachiae]
MTTLRPIEFLDTHEVTNQPPPLEGFDRFGSDKALRDAVTRSGGQSHFERLSEFGLRTGSTEVLGWGEAANRNVPVLETHDRNGRRIDEVRFHPAYHELMALGLNCGVAASAWDGTEVGHTFHAALSFLIGQADAGTGCPMTMTYAAVAALSVDSEIGDEWIPRITASRYDPAVRPANEKAGVTIGMAMTEKQGGSDVRANTTRAEAADGAYRLTGHKWFCSAPMCDAFLTLAYAEGGLTCFLVPRWTPDGERNAGFRVMRLKDKLGDRSNASSEVEYHQAYAERLGEEGRGVPTIIQMVQHTRLDCIVGSAATMRAALVEALWHTSHRTAFQRGLADQPAMAAVLADLAVESEAATALGFRVAAAFDADEQLARLLTPIAKYWVCKRAPGMVYEAMECLGGSGYVEAGPMPRLFRQSPLNAIWEGSGNVIALDVLRAMAREPEALDALQAFLSTARGRHPSYDRWLDDLDFDDASEQLARHTVERLALAAQGAVLIGAESPVAEAFCRLRFEGSAFAYGASDTAIDARAIIERATPALG